MFKTNSMICLLMLVLGMGQVEGADRQSTDDQTLAEWYTGVQIWAWDKLSGEAVAWGNYAIEVQNWMWEQLPSQSEVEKRLKELKNWALEQPALSETMEAQIDAIRKKYADLNQQVKTDFQDKQNDAQHLREQKWAETQKRLEDLDTKIKPNFDEFVDNQPYKNLHFQGEQALEREVHQKVNEYRQSKGLQPLGYNEAIADIARKHSENMANGLIPSGHYGIQQRYDQIHVAIQAIFMGENVAVIGGRNMIPAPTAINGWMNSETHRENMEESQFAVTGVGVAVSKEGIIYITQMFAK